MSQPRHIPVLAAEVLHWLDPRPRYLEQWTIPLRYADRALSISGGMRSASPAPGASTPRGSSGTPWWVFLLAGIALGSAAAIALALRRRR